MTQPAVILSEEDLELLKKHHVKLHVPFEDPKLAEQIEKLLADYEGVSEQLEKTLKRLRGLK